MKELLIKAIETIPEQPRSELDTTEQLRLLKLAGEQLGLMDAADVIGAILKRNA